MRSDFQKSPRFRSARGLPKDRLESLDFQNQPQLKDSPNALGNGAAAPIELTIGACARIARVHRDVIDEAMKTGALPFHRDTEGHRVSTWPALTEWLRPRAEEPAR